MLAVYSSMEKSASNNARLISMVMSPATSEGRGAVSAGGLLYIFVIYCTNYIPRVRLEHDLTICRNNLQGPNRTQDLTILDCSNRFVKSFSRFAVCDSMIRYNKLDVFDVNRQIFFLVIKKIVLDLMICGTNSQPNA